MTVDANISAALFDDAVDGRQAKSGAFSYLLGGEERLEDVRQNLWADASSGIAHGKHDVWAGTGARMVSHIVFIQGDVRGFDRDPSATLRGVARVHDKVHHHLLDLARDRPWWRRAGDR